MDISFATPTTLDSPEHVAIAEELGYKRAWFYDTPQQSPDVWMMLALTAQRTERIGLGPGVLVPSLRHPMVNAAATAALEAMAPGRVAVAFGTGFSSRRAMGEGPLKWAFMEAYIKVFKGLLRGEVVEWEGSRLRMLHPEGHAAPRPVEVPVIIGALGPKGGAIARQLADGLIAVAGVPDFAKEFSWVTYLGFGTVLDEGEDPQSERVRDAAGPATMITYHSIYEYGGSLAELPGGEEWLAVIEQNAEAGASSGCSSPAPGRSQQRRSGRLERGRSRDGRIVQLQRHQGEDQGQGRAARRPGRHRNRLPARRARYPPRVECVHGSGISRWVTSQPPKGEAGTRVLPRTSGISSGRSSTKHQDHPSPGSSERISGWPLL